MTDETTVLPEPVPEPVTGPATATGAAPVFEPAPEPAGPVPSPATAPPTGPSRRRRATGTAGQAVGIIGIVVSLLLVVGVIIGRGWLVDQVEAVETTLVSTVEKAAPMVGTAQETLVDVEARLGEVATAAERIAADPNATPQLLQGVLERLNGLSERYLELRTGYAGLREQVMTALSRLELIDRLVPGIDIPDGPVDAVADLDARIQELDAQIMQLIEIASGLGDVNTAAATIAEKSRAVEDLLGNVTDALGRVDLRLDTLQADIAGAADTISTVITVLSLLLVLALLYVALLHWVLFRSSRGYLRGPAAS